MKYNETKTFHREIELLPHVDQYLQIMGTMCRHVRWTHEEDRRELLTRLGSVADIVFERYLSDLKAIRQNETPETTLEAKVILSITFTQLRREHKRIWKRIRAGFSLPIHWNHGLRTFQKPWHVLIGEEEAQTPQDVPQGEQ